VKNALGKKGKWTDEPSLEEAGYHTRQQLTGSLGFFGRFAGFVNGSEIFLNINFFKEKFHHKTVNEPGSQNGSYKKGGDHPRD
jgi:hypothetical protein